MIEDCLVGQQFPSSVRGDQCQIDSPSSCGVFEYSQTDACPETQSSSSVTVNPTENLRLTKEVGIQCELLVCENQVAMTSVAIQTADVCPPSVDVSDIATPGTPIAVVDCLKPNSDISFIDTQPSTSTFPGNTLVSEKLSPQKSICSELTCTGSDTDSDDIYMPGSSAESQDDVDSESDDETKRSPAEQKKFIVFEENLDKLFVTCSTCFKPNAEVSKTLVGSMVEIHTLCVDGHKNKWQSQPKIDANIAGNVLLAGSILFSGNSFQNINSFAHRLNLAFIGKSFFYDIQKEFLFPVVNKAWKDHQENLFEEVKKSKKLDICGDGRCDSPGHSAKYGTYSVMAESTVVIEFGN